jgi:hypothetical protein
MILVQKVLDDKTAAHELQLQILPRRADAPVFQERRLLDYAFEAEQRVLLKSVELIPQQTLKMNFNRNDELGTMFFASIVN